MSAFDSAAFALAAVTSLALAVGALAQRHRGWIQWSFALGMVGFALESLAGLVLVTGTDLAGERLLWLRLTEVAGLVLLVPWGFFVAVLMNPERERLPLGWRLGLAGGIAIVLAGAAAVAAFPTFEVADVAGPFYAARLGSVGLAVTIAKLVATVALLGALEASLRSSAAGRRWRMKYLILGLGGVCLVRFYVLSHLLLFQVLMAAYLTTHAATLVVGNLVIGVSLIRQGVGRTDVAVSRDILYRSVIVGVLGVYLFVVGALGWLLNRLGVPEETFWGSLVVFVSALGLAVLVFSEDVRWRVKRFIGRHVYRSKYDYRQQWAAFTRRTQSALSMDGLAPQILAAVTEAVGTTRGALYLADERDGVYHLVATTGVGRPALTIDARSPVLARAGKERAPHLLVDAADGTVAPLPGSGPGEAGEAIAVPLSWQGRLTGLVLIGPERAGAGYTAEDIEFLTTVAEQAAGVIVAAHLSECLAQAREFEAFHRLTSFVIHDLKNSTSALSMLSQNALANFGDPDFQRDALMTLSRTVERMKGLLARLSSAPEGASLHLEPVDLTALAAEATATCGRLPGVTFATDLGVVRPISGDPDALLRVIQNLAANAVEALDGRGAVTVRTYEEAGHAVLSVRDTGCGIPEHFLRKSLFTPFRSTKKGGWGIGLYQAKGIVERHGGRIEVASREGEGTTFWVKLPIACGGQG